MTQAMYLHAAHDHSFWEELLERFADHLPGGEATVEFLSHMIADTTQIYLILAIIMFFVFLAQSYVRTDRMQKKLTELKSVWGYLLAIALGMISPFCSCTIIPVLMGLVAVGVPVSVCLCMLTSASLLNITALTALYTMTGTGFATTYLVCSLLIVLASSVILSRISFQNSMQDYHLAKCSCDAHEHHHEHTHEHAHEHHHEHDHHHEHGADCCRRPTHSFFHEGESKACTFQHMECFLQCMAVDSSGCCTGCRTGSILPAGLDHRMISGNVTLSTLIAAIVGFPLDSDIFSIFPILYLLRDIYPPVAMTFTLAAMVASVPGVILLCRALKPKAVGTYVGVLVVLTLIVSFLLLPVSVLLQLPL